MAKGSCETIWGSVCSSMNQGRRGGGAEVQKRVVEDCGGGGDGG